MCEVSRRLRQFLGRRLSAVCPPNPHGNRLLIFVGCLLLVRSVSSAQTPLQWISFNRQNLMTEGSSGGALGGSGIRATGSSARNVSLAVSLPGMAVSSHMLMADSHAYTQLIVPGSGQSEVGKPDVPVFGQWVLVPNGTGLSIWADPGEPLVFNDIDVPPVQPPAPDIPGAAAPAFRKDAVTYATNADYPGVFGQAEPIRNVRGQDCTVVWLYPYQYNPLTRQLSVYRDLLVELEFDGDIHPIPMRLESAEFARVFKRLAPNAEAVLSAESRTNRQTAAIESLYAVGAETSTQSIGNGQTGGCDHLIICDPAFLDAADALADWKRLSGFRTRVVTTDDTGVDAADIEAYIDASQRDWLPAPSHVLLLGDAEYIPCFYELTHASDLEGTEGLRQGKIASDRYYGDTNEDGVADVFVGRLPVNTPSEAWIAVERIIGYERTPPDPVAHRDFYTSFAGVAYFYDDSPADGYADTRYVRTVEDICQYLNDANCSGERIYYTDADVEPTNWSTQYIFESDAGGGQPLPDHLILPDFGWDGSMMDISNAVNNGVFLLAYRGHGSRLMRSIPPGWSYPGGWMQPAFQEHNAAALTNGPLVPVVFSGTCMAGWFDNETDDETYEMYSDGSIVGTYETAPSDESLCEQFILNGNGGAVGVIGATRVSYSGRNDRLVWGWMDAIWPDFIEYHNGAYGDSDPVYQMGPVFEYGKQYMLTKYSYDWDYTKTAIDELVWFGDPTMEIRTAVPERLTAADVAHPALINVSHPVDVTITVRRSDMPLADARVTLSRAAAPGDYWTGLTDASGGITFADLTTSQQGDYNLVVTAHNYIPYEGIIASEAVSGGAITVERQVSASADDGYACDGVSQDLDADYLRVGSSGEIPLPYHVSGMVFRNINVPQGAEIISAHLSIRSYDSHLTEIVYGKIEAEATDDAAGFGPSRHIASLSTTGAGIIWDIEDPWSADTWYTSPDISSVIQEVVDRQGWSANNALSILYGTRQRLGGSRCFCSYDRGGTYAPKLQITYAMSATRVISGKVTFLGGGLADVRMDGFPGSVTTDAAGDYRAQVEYGWSGLVTPSKFGYVFAPSQRQYAGVTFDQTHDYTATRRTYILSGRVLASDGSGMPGVILTASNGGGSTTTDTTGSYSLAVSHGWSGRVAPSKAGYDFTPAYQDYVNITDDWTTISGYVRTSDGLPVSEATVSLEDRVASGVTDASGHYSLAVPHDWSGRVTAMKTGYVFTPAYRDYASISHNWTDQDYLATTQGRTISGAVRSSDGSAIAGVTISADNGATATTSSTGAYSLTVPNGWSGRVTPSRAGYLFDPAYRDYRDVTSDQTGSDFVRIPSYTISGHVRTWDGEGISDVTVSANNDGGSSTTDLAGYYNLPVPRGWSGRVAPSKTGYIFNPNYRDYTNVSRNRTNRNYSGETALTP